MNYFDLAFLVIAVLFTVLGVIRGFFKTLASFCGWFVAFVLAIVFAKAVASFLTETEFIRNLFFRDSDGFSFYKKIYSAMPDGLKEIDRGQMAAAINGAEDPVSALQKLISGKNFLLGLLSSLFKGSLLQPLTNPEILSFSFDNLAQGFSLLISGSLLVVFSGIILFAVLRLVTFILQLLVHDFRLPGILDKIFGGVMGAVRALCFTVVVLMAIGLTLNFGFMTPVGNELYGVNGRKSEIVLPIAEKTFALTDKFVSFKDVEKIFVASDFVKTQQE